VYYISEGVSSVLYILGCIKGTVFLRVYQVYCISEGVSSVLYI
jgi:hypothetical protein